MAFSGKQCFILIKLCSGNIKEGRLKIYFRVRDWFQSYKLEQGPTLELPLPNPNPKIAIKVTSISN